MSRTDRTVHHLHLRAPTAQAVRRAVHGLEDALRCASLPDAGERVLLVRQLHLGTLPKGLSPQSLSLLIEQRVADVGGSWVHGDDETRAARSNTVFFPNRLHAAKAALRRHALGEPMEGWHWPLALPGVNVHAPPAEFLAQLLESVRHWPEAPVAMAALADHGQSEVRDWWSAYAPPEWRELPLKARARGERAYRPTAHATEEQAPAGPRAATAHRGAEAFGEPDAEGGPTASRRNTQAAPRRVASAGQDAGQGPALHASQAPPVERSQAPGPDGQGAQRRSSTLADPRDAFGNAPTSLLQPPPPEWAFGLAAARAQAQGAAVAAAQAPLRLDAFARPDTEDDTASGALLETRAGGVLFLWPVLQRVGFDDWDAAHPEAWMAPQVLQLALQRQRLPPDDPAWALLASLPTAPRMAAGRRAVEPGCEAWLRRCRQHARRVLRIGLASLVQRTAWLHWSDTHIDVHFRLRDADLRVRRVGLDVDPGWVGALQRVVAFHFDQ